MTTTDGPAADERSALVRTRADGPWPHRLLDVVHARRSAAVLVAGDLLVLSSPILVLPASAAYWLMSSVLTVWLLALSGLYRPRLQWSVLDDLPALVGARCTAAAVVGLLLVPLQPDLLPAFLTGALWTGVLLLLSRALTYAAVIRARLAGRVVHRCLVVGGGVVAAEAVGLLSRHRELGLTPIGYVDDRDSEDVERHGCERLGSMDQLDEVVRHHQATVLLVTFGGTRDNVVSAALRSPSASRCTLFVVPRLYEVMSLKGVRDHIGAIPVLRVRRPPRFGFAPAAKRVFDIVVSALALVVLSPVLVACAVAVRMTGPGVLFRQERVGQDGQLFELLKFRSMSPQSTAVTSTTWSAHGDPRVTVVGRFLRRTSLDELPQLVNILRGEMTVVGPRPERPFFAEQFSREFPPYAHRHRVPVGLTGMAQVSGLRGGDASIELRARYDNYYIENWSLWGDIKVILRTVIEVVRGRGA